MAVAVISVNALTYFGWCAALDERLDAENVSVSVSAHGVSAGHISFSATLEYMPTLFGLGLKSEVMGVALPKLSHTEELVVDCYKPGVLL